jgi:hypothetical protein
LATNSWTRRAGGREGEGQDSGVINFNKEKPFSQIVTWSLTVP